MVIFAPYRNAAQTKIAGQIVVITGASAGVGRAAARAFAREGAKVALLARDAAGLESTRAEIEAIGGEAKVFPLDVADAAAVNEAADQCEAEFGPISIWVNNAMATVFSPVAELTPEEIRRVTEVTYLGYVYGTLAALRHMRSRDRGVILQVGSSLAYRGIPLQAAYCGAKHAIRGFTDSLRAELLHEGSNIRITAVHLPAINTPQFDWARTKMDKRPRPVAPVYTAQGAGRAVVHAARNPRREYWVGSNTPLTIAANMLFPGLLDRYLGAKAVEGQQDKEEVDRNRTDNLFSSASGHRTDGSFGSEARRAPAMVSADTARGLLITGGCILIGVAGAVLGAMLTSGRVSPRRRLPFR